jgi:HlyD family secretion protein
MMYAQTAPRALVSGRSAAFPAAGISDDPIAEIRAGLLIAVAFFVVFLGWAAFARLDAAAFGVGRTIVAGQRQSVQHRDGGIVGAIFVKEGQSVRRGDVLIRLAAPAVAAQERVLASQAIWLIAQRARLRAEQAGNPTIATPPEFAVLDSADRAEALAALRSQQAQQAARGALLHTQESVARREGDQAGHQADGYQQQVVAINEQERLLTDELDSLRGVAEKGFVSMTRIRALERARADLVGQRGRLRASQASSTSIVGESRLKAIEAGQTLQEKVASELRDVETLLADAMPKWSAAQDEVARTEIRAPVSGTVVGLSVFTVGGVIAAGQKLMDIVPRDAGLVVEARFAPNDVDDLVVGQDAETRFAGLSDRSLPIIRGRLSRLSADSFSDERSGASYFIGEVQIGADQVALLRRRRGASFELKPGMPVEVIVPLRRRTALQYLFEPLADAAWRSFREH